MPEGRICLYYRIRPEPDRWLPGDRYPRALLRRMIRGRPRPGGVDKVFVNLCKGLDRLGVRYDTNLSFQKLRPNDRVGVLGRGRHCLDGYNKSNPIVAGIGLMTHPSEWPTRCDDYPVVRYLQHSEWANNVYRPYFGDRCKVWPVGIDTDEWRPSNGKRPIDFLIYDKIRWDQERLGHELLEPIQAELRARALTFEILRYGHYNPGGFKNALSWSKAMIFLCEHESQGLAYQEALSSGMPILAWDQGWCLDPNRFAWGDPGIPATSVPYFDERCGLKFKDFDEFESKLDEFVSLLHKGVFSPREYIIENLTLEKCAQRYLDIWQDVADEL
jgi:hypothetical protein